MDEKDLAFIPVLLIIPISCFPNALDTLAGSLRAKGWTTGYKAWKSHTSDVINIISTRSLNAYQTQDAHD